MKKRKQTPQSATLFDFFGNKGCDGSGSRDAKKARVKDVVASKARPVRKRSVLPEDIIVIDSDEDEVICLSPGPPANLPKRSKSNGHEQAGGEIAEAQVLPAILGDISPNVKGEVVDQTDVLRFSHLGEKDMREPSPFGFPDLLIADSDNAQLFPRGSSSLADCLHDGEVKVESVSDAPGRENGDVTTVEDAPLYGADWNMGDDEIEFGPIETQVKVEGLEDVDVDLTLDEEGLAATNSNATESCPICDKRLAGFSAQPIHEHVDRCIDASSEAGLSTSSATTPSSSKTLRPLSSLPAPHPLREKDSRVTVEAKQEGGGANVFSTLMTSYKENEAWKEASAAEDRNFRPTKANGGRRKAPFYKVLQGMPIAVDAFRYGAIPNVTAYFLTHAHSDHYTNLSANWKAGPIYCSEGTANLIIHMLGVDQKWVYPLPMDTPTTIPNTGGVQVTLIEANHCPGSCLFLFEGKQTVNAGDSVYKSPFVGSSKVFRYLHCGDFRASPQHVLHPAIKGKHIDHVYLDTTYLDPKYCFPPHPQVISACAELAKRLMQGRPPDDHEGGKPRTMAGWFTRAGKSEKGKGKAKASDASDRTLIVVGTYSIGKERIVKAIAKALGTKVYCDSRKAAILRCEDDPELHALLTGDPEAGDVHLVPLGVIASDRLKQYVDRWKGRYSKVIGFRPTGWTYTQPNGSDNMPSIPAVISRSQSRTFTYANLQPMRNSTSTLQVYGVPYSEHSSFFELTCFALSLDWGRMIATVNVGSETSRGKMAKWVERWEAERKKRGGPQVVEYRAEDYW